MAELADRGDPHGVAVIGCGGLDEVLGGQDLHADGVHRHRADVKEVLPVLRVGEQNAVDEGSCLVDVIEGPEETVDVPDLTDREEAVLQVGTVALGDAEADHAGDHQQEQADGQTEEGEVAEEGVAGEGVHHGENRGEDETALDDVLPADPGEGPGLVAVSVRDGDRGDPEGDDTGGEQKVALGEEVVGDDADAGCPGVDGQQVGDDGRGEDREEVTGDVEPRALGVTEPAGVAVPGDPVRGRFDGDRRRSGGHSGGVENHGRVVSCGSRPVRGERGGREYGVVRE